MLEENILKLGDKGNEVASLHKKLTILKHKIADEELTKNSYGETTKAAIEDFQRKRAIAVTGVVDRLTFQQIKKAAFLVDDIVWKVSGTVKHEDSTSIEGVTVHAIDRDPIKEKILGKSVTDKEGKYQIEFTRNNFSRKEKIRPVLLIKVLSPENITIAQSEAKENTEINEIIDIEIVVKKDIKETTKLQDLIKNLIPITSVKSLAFVVEKDIKKIAEQTDITLVTLKDLKLSAKLSIKGDFPLNIIYALVKYGKEKESYKILNLEKDEIKDRINKAFKEKDIFKIEETTLESFIEAFTAYSEKYESKTYTFSSKLIENKNKGLSNYLIEAYLEKEGETEELVYSTISGESGEFNISYEISFQNKEEIDIEINLILKFVDQRGNFISSKNVKATLDREQKQDIVLKTDNQRNEIEKLVKDLELTSLNGFLKENKITRIEDIRKSIIFFSKKRAANKGANIKKGFFKRVKRAIDWLTKNNDNEFEDELNKLLAAVRLHPIVPENNLKNILIEKSFTDFHKIADVSPEQFIETIGKQVGYSKSLQIHQKAFTINAHLSNINLEDNTVQLKNIGDIEGDASSLDTKCECKDCESAVSPAAYLTELLRYSQKKLMVKNFLAIDTDSDFFENTFYQAFKSLPVNCEATEQKIPQVRIAIEVLIRFILDDENLPEQVEEKNKLIQGVDDAFSEYLKNAYRDILSELGTSHTEIRLLSTSDSETKKSIASRIGIGHKYLGTLFIAINNVTEQGLEDRFGLRAFRSQAGNPVSPTKNIDGFSLQKWKLEYLRYLWYQQDFPKNPFSDHYIFEIPSGEEANLDTEDFSENLKNAFSKEYFTISDDAKVAKLSEGKMWFISGEENKYLIRKIKDQLKIFIEREHPIIDPDLIGPDDVCFPKENNKVYDLWVKRRIWLDEKLDDIKKTDEWIKMLKKEFVYEGFNTIIPWSNNVDLNKIDEWSRKLKIGKDIEVVKKEIKSHIKLDFNRFNRLTELLDISRKSDAENDKNHIELADEEKTEFYNIIISSIKNAFTETWIIEERKENILLGLKDFWISQTEPLIGNWRLQNDSAVLVDPEIISLEDLPDSVFGKPVIELWHQRQEWLIEARNKLHKIYSKDNDIDKLLKDVFGAAYDEKKFNDLFNTLNQGLDEGDENFKNAIEELDKLKLSVEDFTFIMKVKNSEGDINEGIFQKLLIILARLKWIYIPEGNVNNWVEQENELKYWEAFKQRLPKWLSSLTMRRYWQLALKQNSKTPIIEPDYLSIKDHFKKPLTENETVEVFNTRREWIENRIIKDRPINDIEDEYEKIVKEKVGVTTLELTALEEKRRKGLSISNRLKQLSLSFATFGVLIRMKDLIDVDPNTILKEEWDDFFDIILQIEKSKKYAEWREEERIKGYTLSPDNFLVQEIVFQFPLPSSEPLNQRRVDTRYRRKWFSTLESRIEQEKELKNSIQEMLRKVEEKVLPNLRDSLIDISTAEGISTVERADWLSKRLLIDLQMDGCSATTRISTATGTLQNLLWSLRTGLLKDTYPDFKLQLPAVRTFDEDWVWLGSYAAWRAATFIYMYPQNVLHPALKKYQSWQFSKTIEYISERSGITPTEALKLSENYEKYYFDISKLEIEVSCQVTNYTYWYAISREGRCYWSSFEREEGPFADHEYAQTPWFPLLMAGDEVKVKGFKAALPFQGSDENPDAIIIFAIRESEDSNTDELVTFKHNYKSRGNDFKELGVFELISPFNEDLKFDFEKEDIVITQNRHVDTPIKVVYSINESEYYLLEVSDDGKNWVEEIENYESYEKLPNEINFLGKTLNFDNDLPLKRVKFFFQNEVTEDELFYTFFIENRDDSNSLSFIPYRKYYSNDNPLTEEDESSELTVIKDPIEIEHGDEKLNGYWIGAFSLPKTGGQEIFAIANTQIGVIGIRISSGNKYVVYQDYYNYVYDISNLKHISIDSGMPTPSTSYLIIAENSYSNLWTAIMYDVRTMKRGNPWYYSFTYNIQPWQITPSAHITSFPPKPGLPIDTYELRREHIKDVYQSIDNPPSYKPTRSAIAYFEEYYYFLPLLLSLELQRKGYYQEALDWFRLIYDYTEPDPNNRKIWYGLVNEENEDLLRFERGLDWLKDPLNPHSIAAERNNTYTRYTLQSLISCLLDYADAQFTIDTSKTLKEATELYKVALELLDEDVLSQNIGECERIIAELMIEIGEATSEVVSVERVSDLESVLRTVEDYGRLEVITTAVQERLTEILLEYPNEPIPDDIWNGLLELIPNEPNIGVVTINDKLDGFELESIRVYDQLLSNDIIYNSALQIGKVAVIGKPIDVMPMENMDAAQPFVLKMLSDNNLGILNSSDVYINSRRNPAPVLGFCIPPNPILFSLRLQANVNLFKIRNCLNIAGMRRELEPYSAPTDTTSGMPYIGSGGQLNLPGTFSIRPTIYRFGFLLEKSKQLVQIAAQVESAMLNSIEKKDNEEYIKLQQKQNIKLSKEEVKLQNLKLKEAEERVDLSELSRELIEIKQEYYAGLIEEGWLLTEEVALGLSITAGVAHLIAGGIYSGLLGDPNAPAQASSSAAAALSVSSSVLSTIASYERRRQDWVYQLSLANQEYKISDQEIRIAKANVRVVGQEGKISELKAEYAEDIGEFLDKKFTNDQLYSWMGNVLENIYRYFLNQATSMAKLAYNQLAFERQETPPVIIQDSYWDISSLFSNGIGGNSETSDKRGLTGSAKLQKDINRLEQYEFETKKKKFQLSRTISMASLDAYAFAKLRQTGKLNFRTNMELFDRDHPGHYLRLIKRVKVSIVALIPAVDGIKATLTNTGLSRVVVGDNLFQTILIRREPEKIALSTAQNAMGLFEFEMNNQSEILFPFEGSGVDSLWEFEISKNSNFFDYNTIADVLITIEYTSMESYIYKQQIIQELGDTIENSRVYSFRNQFADAWYDLHNPLLTQTPMKVNLDIRKADFPANINELSITGIEFFIVRARKEKESDKKPSQLTVSLGFIPLIAIKSDNELKSDEINLFEASSNDGIYSTFRGNASSWFSFMNQQPFGKWVLQLPNTEDVRLMFNGDEKKIEDIIFSISYTGRTYGWDDV